jgi:hypothetical protein
VSNKVEDCSDELNVFDEIKELEDKMSLKSKVEYEDKHKDLAEKEMKRLIEELGVKSHNEWYQGDGWSNDLSVLWAVIEKDDVLFKICWHVDNEEFFADTKYGSSPLRLCKDFNKQEG